MDWKPIVELVTLAGSIVVAGQLLIQWNAPHGQWFLVHLVCGVLSGAVLDYGQSP
jgi:hypothetical protein